jgi:hypothetical protein
MTTADDAEGLWKELDEALERCPGVCRECGCTSERPCASGCTWIEEDLCSACALADVADFEDLADFDEDLLDEEGAP